MAFKHSSFFLLLSVPYTIQVQQNKKEQAVFTKNPLWWQPPWRPPINFCWIGDSGQAASQMPQKVWGQLSFPKDHLVWEKVGSQQIVCVCGVGVVSLHNSITQQNCTYFCFCSSTLQFLWTKGLPTQDHRHPDPGLHPLASVSGAWSRMVGVMVPPFWGTLVVIYNMSRMRSRFWWVTFWWEKTPTREREINKQAAKRISHGGEWHGSVPYQKTWSKKADLTEPPENAGWGLVQLGRG